MSQELDMAISAVQALNELVDPDNNQRKFTVETDGFEVLVNFGGITLWYSEDDDRQFDDNTGTYEPLMDYLKTRVNRLINQLKDVAIKIK